ncbi:ubiquitin-associated domain-containing protein 2-like isoform X3 [Mucor ambiguus]|uniref:Ubiquitin-associated domain-containing protein 2-like isoform X3 n=1 Tax=Mucor ambiguus TaxID=91626 RepID=A0A0C9LVF3_9FUNG|nr:ubiquitin-associated domain-containing protein 2-like isoform X3 [Mucor ambiguus]
MDADGPSGFRNAPVTKFLVPVVSSCSALAITCNLKPHMALQLSHLGIENGQVWRLFTSHWAFSSIGTTVVGAWLIYKMKVVERRYGSARYAALVFISFVASTLLQTGVLVVGSRYGFKSIASGPYAILFSILYQYQKMIPASYQVNLLGATLSDKIYVYAAATHLLLSNSSSSVIPSMCGLAVGALYDMTASVKQWRFPKWTRSFTTKYILPVLATNNKKKASTMIRTPDIARSSTTASSSTTMRQRYVPTSHLPPPPPPPPIKEEDIETMFAMFPNYSRQDIKNALVSSKSDLNRAAEILLTTQPSAGSSGSNNSSQ